MGRIRGQQNTYHHFHCNQTERTKTIQKPHIRIYLGGYSQGTFVRIANCASG